MPVAKTIIGLTDCVNLGLITDGRYFEIGTEVIRSITDEIQEWPEGKPLIDEWVENLFQYLFGKFKDLDEESEWKKCDACRTKAEVVNGVKPGRARARARCMNR